MQWLSGRVLDSRPRGCGFVPHQRHCVVSFSKNINPSLVLVQPRKTRPLLTERLLMGRKESDQTKTYPCEESLGPGLTIEHLVRKTDQTAQMCSLIRVFTGHTCQIEPLTGQASLNIKYFISASQHVLRLIYIYTKTIFIT